LSALDYPSNSRLLQAANIEMATQHRRHNYHPVRGQGMIVFVRAGYGVAFARRILNRQAQADEELGRIESPDWLFVPAPARGEGRLSIRLARVAEYPTGQFSAYAFTLLPPSLTGRVDR